MRSYSLAALESEGSLSNVSKEDLEFRLSLVEAFRSVPKEAIVNLRHLLPQAGCLNRCSFCSQSASPTVYQLTERALKNLFAAIKTVSLEVASRYITSSKQPYLVGNALSSEGVFLPQFQMPKFGLVGYSRTNHRPGVIFPYLDNDIASYPFLLQYMKYMREDLGVKVRLSTVGYSRRNGQLQEMHKRINENHLETLRGVRISFSPYTLGWTTRGERSGLTSREEFILDLANLIKTYRPAIEHMGAGDRAVSLEFRFPPMVSESEVEDVLILNRHVIHAGPYMLISTAETDSLPNFSVARIKAESRHSLSIDELFSEYIMVISVKLADNGEWRGVAKTIIEGGCRNIEEILPDCTVRHSKLYLLENGDGPYYAVDPEMTEFGYFAKEFYFLSERRSVSGYIDSERYFLNALLKHKRSRGIGRRESFFNASWSDADEVVNLLEKKMTRMEGLDPVVAFHLKEHVLPMVSAYRKILEMSGLPALYFFDKSFTIDTGEICNLGGAYKDYRGLASRKNSAVTPQHERVYSANGSLATEGKIWIIGVSPMNIGFRGTDISVSCPSLFVEEQNLSKRSSQEGHAVRRWYIPLRKEDVEVVNSSSHKHHYLIPGKVSI